MIKLLCRSKSKCNDFQKRVRVLRAFGLISYLVYGYEIRTRTRTPGYGITLFSKLP